MMISMQQVIRVLKRSALWLTLFPTVLALTVLYFTRNMPHEYTSTASIYTGIASGYSITNTDVDKIDFQAVNNAFDNLIATIKARETITEVSLQLLAKHLTVAAPRADQLNQKSFEDVQKMLDPTLRRATVKGNQQATYRNLHSLAYSSKGNIVKTLLYQSTTPYAVEEILGNLTASRRNVSDMLDLTYKGNDPAVCQQALTYLIAAFKEKYNSLRSSETNNVVGYFENQARQSYQNLKGAEDKLTKYGVDNQIINYQEQSRYTAGTREQAVADYHKEKMALQAAESANKTLSGKLDEQSAILLAGNDLTAKRNELAQVQNRLSNASVYGASAETISQLKATAERLSNELRTLVQQYYSTTTAKGVVPQRELMDDYLSSIVQTQESAARVGVMERWLQDYNQIYRDMAPLGSSVNRLERQINVAEREYLTILNSLNTARLRQKNLEMSGSLNVLDPPLLPMKPQSSVRKILVIASYMAGLILVLAIAIGRLLLDGAIRTPERATRLTGLSLAGAFPLVSLRQKQFNLDRLEHWMIEQLRSRLLISTANPAPQPQRPSRLITLFSTQQGQGKTWVGERISNQFARAGHRVCYFYPETSSNKPETQAITIEYPVESDFADTQQIGVFMQLIPDIPLMDVDYIFLELPDLHDSALPVRLIGQSDLSLMLVGADMSWSASDKALLELYANAAQSPVMSVLNQAEPDFLKGLVGPVPRWKKQKSSKKTDSTPVPVQEAA